VTSSPQAQTPAWVLALVVILAVALALAGTALVRVRRRLARREAESRFPRDARDRVLHSLPDHVTYLDRNLRVIWANWFDRHHRAGRRPARPLAAGAICHAAIAGRDAPCPGCPAPAVLRPGLPGEGLVLCRDGTVLGVTGSPVRDEGGELAGVVVTSRDITEQRPSAERLQQSQKMESVGQLAAGVAHDFNNNLQVILGFGELLSNALPRAGELRTYIEAILRAGRQARGVVSQLLIFSRKQEPRLERLDLAACVEACLDGLRELVGASIEIRFAAAAALPPVLADPAQVELVLRNLCANARDAMPGGGCLDLRMNAETLDATAAARRGAPACGAYVVLSVVDQGDGIPVELQNRVFDPVFTTKEVDRGAGLGLAAVYGIVTAHHGFLQLVSTPGQGAAFEVGWPAAGSFAVAAAAPDVATVARRAATILVVEDDPGVRQLAVAVLRREGHRVDVAQDGNEALERLLGDGARVDLVIMDVLLPGLSGWSVYRRVCRQRPDLRLIFCSGHRPVVLGSEFQMALPGLVFLQKPYAAADLVAKVRVLLGGQVGRAAEQSE